MKIEDLPFDIKEENMQTQKAFQSFQAEKKSNQFHGQILSFGIPGVVSPNFKGEEEKTPKQVLLGEGNVINIKIMFYKINQEWHLSFF